MKLACVVQRYGTDIAGGSEAHCRGIAEHLAARHDVTVLTTTAFDHVTWRNAYPSGVSRMGPVSVRRFRVRRRRSLHRFAEISDVVFGGGASDAEQEAWFRENGPDVPDLLDYLDREGDRYDQVLFWAFRYSSTFFGVPRVPGRAVLVPTAEDDSVIRFGILERFLAHPAGFVFLTPEERALVERAAGKALAPACVIGSGVDPVGPRPPSGALAALGVHPPFVLYLGRIDPNKGCEGLVRDFVRYWSGRGTDVPLVLAGPANMPIPDYPAIRMAGFVNGEARDALLAHAAVLVVPSLYESLSMVLLEAWNHGVPALVNGSCAVLRGQVLRANGGLYYRNHDEFARALEYLLEHGTDAARLGAQGRAYIDREYRWPHVMHTLETFLSQL